MIRTATVLFVSAIAATASADTHTHIGIFGTDHGSGPALEIRAGYLASESDYSIDDQRNLMFGDERAEISGSSLATDGPFAGWFQIDIGNINPTADFFASTLTGADTHYEIVSAIAADGSGTDGALGFHYHAHHGDEDITASSDASDLAGRSIPMPAGTHLHGYSYYLRDAGTYEITLRAYDANGVFSSDGLSEVRFLVSAVPTPGALGVLAAGGLIASRRRRASV